MADVVLTLLILACLSALVQGSVTVSWLGVTWQTPSLATSLVLLGLWIAGRTLVGRRAQLSSLALGASLRERVPEILLAGLFLVGLTLRLRGIDFGEPLLVHPDEGVVVGVSTWMLQTGWIQPPVPYHYPTVFPYLLMPAFALYYVRGQASGLWTSLEDMDREAFGFYEIARAHSAVLGALTIVLTYILATRMWPGRLGRWTGVVAAAFVTFSFNHVKESHYAVTDAALAFFVALAFLAILAAYRRGTTGAYLVAGFACGIACATKYSGLPVVAGLIAAHVADRVGMWTRWPRLLAGLVAVPVGFFAGYPYALLNWPPFLEHLGWMSGVSASGGYDAAARFDYLVAYSTDSGFGYPLTILLGIALLVTLYRRRPEELMAVVVMAVAVALMTHSAHRFFPRYLLPILPFASLVAAGTLVSGAEWLSGRLRTYAAAVPVAAVLVVLLVVWPQAREALSFVRGVTLPDTRSQAYAYILERYPPGSIIASEEPFLRLPDGYELLRWSPLHEHGPDEFIDEQVDALVFSSDRDGGPPTTQATRADLRRRFPLAMAFPGNTGVASGPTISVHLGDAE